MSTTGDSTSTDKLEADGALILRPSVYQSSKGILSEWKLHKKERSSNRDVMSPGIELGT